MMNRGMKILEKPQMKDLRYKIQNALNYFVDDILGIVQNFQSQSSWVNKTANRIHRQISHSIALSWSILWTRQGNVLL